MVKFKDIIMGIDKASKEEHSVWRAVDMNGNPLAINKELQDLKFELLSKGLNFDFINTLTIDEMKKLNEVPDCYTKEYLMKINSVFDNDESNNLINELKNLKRDDNINKNTNHKRNDDMVMGLFVKLQTEDNLW
jgi:hypothetical protein